MKIAVIGGTGMTGRRVVERIRALGHDALSVSRASNVDVTTGEGLDFALVGVQRIIDVTNAGTTDEDPARRFFTAVAAHLQDAGERAGVEHITVLSIVGVDRFPSGYYRAKHEQEETTRAGTVPATIVRATQFHKFAGQTLQWGRQGNICRVADMRIQPIALATAVDLLVDVALGDHPSTVISEIAGPQEESLPDLVERLARHRGDAVAIVPTREPGPVGDLLATGALLPSPGAWLAGPTFEEWLAAGEGQSVA